MAVMNCYVVRISRGLGCKGNVTGSLQIDSSLSETLLITYRTAEHDANCLV